VRTLHLHLLRETLATLLVTVAVFTFVLLLGNILKDVLDLLASGRASLALVARSILLLIPFALAFALPIGMLTADLRLTSEGRRRLEAVAGRRFASLYATAPPGSSSGSS